MTPADGYYWVLEDDYASTTPSICQLINNEWWVMGWDIPLHVPPFKILGPELKPPQL